MSALSYFLMALCASAGQIKHKQSSWSYMLCVSETGMRYFALLAPFETQRLNSVLQVCGFCLFFACWHV